MEKTRKSELAKLTEELEETKENLQELKEMVAALRSAAHRVPDSDPCTTCEIRQRLLEDYTASNGLEALLESITSMQKQNKQKMKRFKAKYG